MTTDNASDEANQGFKFSPPPKRPWQLSFVADDTLTLRFVNPPNRFHRLTQRILLGFIWRRIDDNR